MGRQRCGACGGAGGNSGGLASTPGGEIIGVPTQLGYGGEDQYVDCRVLADTNRDGYVDEYDNCVPTGGFINALRPINLAMPLIEAAQRGEAWPQAAALWRRAQEVLRANSPHNTETFDLNAKYEAAATECDRMVRVEEALEQIAQTKLQVPTLREQKADDLDFHEVSVWGLKRALAAAYETLDPELRGAMQVSIHRVRAFHQKQPLGSWMDWSPDGGALGQMVRPLERVGVYAPGGRAPYPSTLIMCVVPAQVAGEEEIVVATPPGPVEDPTEKAGPPSGGSPAALPGARLPPVPGPQLPAAKTVRISASRHAPLSTASVLTHHSPDHCQSARTLGISPWSFGGRAIRPA